MSQKFANYNGKEFLLIVKDLNSYLYGSVLERNFIGFVFDFSGICLFSTQKHSCEENVFFEIERFLQTNFCSTG